MEHAGYTNVDFNVVDAPYFCQMINQKSFDWALANSVRLLSPPSR